MTVIEIVAEHLVQHGFGGLVMPDAECGCCLGDLQPCSADFAACKPAYKHANDAGDFVMSKRKDLPTEERDEMIARYA